MCAGLHLLLVAWLVLAYCTPAPVAGLVRMQFAGAVFLQSGARMEASFTKFKANKAVVCLALRSCCNQLCLPVMDDANVLV